MGQYVSVIVKTMNEYKVHLNNKFVLMLVLEGNISLDVSKETVELSKDDLLYINSSLVYSTKAQDKDNLVLMLEIDLMFFNGGLSNLENVKVKNVISENSIASKARANKIRSLIANILIEVDQGNPGFEFRVGTYIYTLGEILTTSCKYLQNTELISPEDLNESRLQRIVDYINTNFQSKVTLKSIAEIENLSYFYLSHFIKSNLGITFQDYLNKVRLDEAIRLLTTSKLSITDISNNSGLPSVGAFNSLFKKEFATTPGAYRREYSFNLNKKPIISNIELKECKHNILKNLENYLEEGSKDESLTNY